MPVLSPTRLLPGLQRQARRQQGAVIVTVALTLLFLLGFAGIAIDFGRLFVLKTELQTAMDSCALAAAQELNGQPDAVWRAQQAGLAAGNLNKVRFQRDAAGLVASDIQFSPTLSGPYTDKPMGTVTHVRCQRVLTGITPLLLHAMDAFAGTSHQTAASSVAAVAVATLFSSQTSCMVPVGVCTKSGGYKRGDWIQGLTNDTGDMDVSGQFRWLSLGDNGGARDIKDILAGDAQCDLPGTATPVTKSGKTNGAIEAWNTRFGIYRSGYAPELNPPDTTGYAWYSNNFDPKMQGRFDAADGYGMRQGLNSPYQGDNQTDSKGLNALLGGATPSTGAVHRAGQANRRVVTVAQINCDGQPIKIQGFLCMLMLHPLEKAASGKKTKMWMEYIADASATVGNPCISLGMPGTGSGGPVPGLVR